MTERYLVRCTSGPGRAMSGIYSAGLTSNGMIATWNQARATRFDSKDTAALAVSRLANKFHGTQWVAEAVGGA